MALISEICSKLFLKLVKIALRSYLKQYHNTSTLVEAMRTIYGPNFVPISFSDVEIAIDTSKAKEVAFTLVAIRATK